MKNFYLLFGSRVREHRKRKELTQLELARTLKLSRASIANIESGKHKPLFHHAMELANALDMSLAELQTMYKTTKLEDALGQSKDIREMLNKALTKPDRSKQ